MEFRGHRGRWSAFSRFDPYSESESSIDAGTTSLLGKFPLEQLERSVHQKVGANEPLKQTSIAFQYPKCISIISGALYILPGM